VFSDLSLVKYAIAGLGGLLVLAWLLGVRHIPNNKVGVVEKLWSLTGSLAGGRIIAFNKEAGFQVDLLRGGIHFGYFPFQYRIHKEALVTIAESKIGYVYARDGQPLPPTQTLGRITECNSFQDARAFLNANGQRGRQRAILREGVFAINNALFVVITEDRVFSGPLRETDEKKYANWQAQLLGIDGFKPVVIGHGGKASSEKIETSIGMTEVALMPNDTIGTVTVHDGLPIDSGEIIAPEVRADAGRKDHNNFQDPEAFLALGGRRGKQLQVLTDGTFFVNRWFATIEMKPKTLIPIGYVGVVVSYFGTMGRDVTGTGFRYGEQVATGERGVWKQALPPGKYPLNPYAMKVELVPTVNFVLRWITGQAEAHQYDKDLTSIDLITADGYEPVLPLSLVLHIDYEKGPSVVQRFGDVKRLISQTLDPILTSYFRDVAQSSNMLDLLTQREEIQRHATEELGRRFQEYDINCIAVLIGRPESKASRMSGGEDPIEKLFDQLRIRRLASEQVATFAKQEDAAKHLQKLADAQAAAAKQPELTQTRIDVEISGNRGEAQLAEAHRLAKRDIARAFGDSRSRELVGHGEAAKIAEIGLAEAAVFLQKIRAYGDSRLFALNLVSEQFSHSAQPIVPERLLVMGGENGNGEKMDLGSSNVFGRLISLLLAEKAGFGTEQNARGLEDLEKFAEQMTRRFSGSAGQEPASPANLDAEIASAIASKPAPPGPRA
jgi:uncharacterized membrane protein YqiK